MNEFFILLETLNHFSPMATCGAMACVCIMIWRFERRILSLEMRLREIFLEKKDFWDFMDRFDNRKE